MFVRRRIRAGRNLPAAIAVGVVLGAFILVPLFTLKAGFVGVVSAAVATAGPSGTTNTASKTTARIDLIGDMP